jgi:hypothetical protein
MLAVAVLFVAGLGAVFFGDRFEAATGVGAEIPFVLSAILGVGALMTTGPVAGRRGRLLRVMIVAGTAAFAAIPVACRLLPDAAARPDERWLGMLPATALFLAGISATPVVILAAYVALFPQSVYGGAEDERFPGLGAAAAGADRRADLDGGGES